ncbi:hypothetical protein [Kitasatospora sp. NPDC088548]|uniref:hypothetical protein n=1 Tax=Kitasatospora sp. NPDC088548 TaxID=3364075 RepID=UPI003804AC60
MLSQGHAVAARMDRDVTVSGTAFGPATVTAQAVGTAVSTGRPGKALGLFESIDDTSSLTPSARNRLLLDIALAQADTRQSDTALDTLLEVCSTAPGWAYRYQYGLDYTFPVTRLVLSDLYLFHSFTAPADEIATHLRQIGMWLDQGAWRSKGDGVWAKGDLRVAVAEYDDHPQDERAGRPTPTGFRSVDLCFISEDFKVPRTVRNLPWDVLAGGMRIKDRRGEPTIAPDLTPILDFLPFQVEVGCGTSIEAGIPPLHYLHEVYRVTDRRDNTLTQSHAFTLSPEADTLIPEMLLSADTKAPDLVAMFRAYFLAEPTAAHRALKALHTTGHLVSAR